MKEDDIQERALIETEPFNFRSYSPYCLKGFSIFKRNDTIKYESVPYNSGRYFLRLGHDGCFLKKYQFYTLYGNRYKVKVLLFKNDENIIQKPNEEDNIWLGRVFSDYPLLSEMAKNKLFDAVSGYESDLMIDEYNSWRFDTSSDKVRDTSITLKAIIDADENYHSKKYFMICRISFFCTFPVVIVPCFVAAIMADTEPKRSRLGIKDYNLMSNTAYLKAYKLRAHTKKAKDCMRGVFLH